MSEENENQPPLETESAAPERRRRPRRRGPRRNFGRSNYNSNDSQANNSGASANDHGSNENMTVQEKENENGRATSVAADDRQVQNQEAGENGEVREPEFGEGIIEISGKGFGFLRDAKRNFIQTPQDIFVTPEIVRRFALRDGMWINGETRRGNRGPQLTRLLQINQDEPAKYQGLRPFEELTTINPNKRIKLETVPDRYTTRIMDLMTPLGMGQRGLIVAPPRTGKTTLLHHIADAVTKKSSGDGPDHFVGR